MVEMNRHWIPFSRGSKKRKARGVVLGSSGSAHCSLLTAHCSLLTHTSVLFMRSTTTYNTMSRLNHPFALPIAICARTKMDRKQGLSRPRFIKVCEPNNTPAFNLLRNSVFSNVNFASGISDLTDTKHLDQLP
ncbi:hypothetical protein VNO78_08367 [Psophocarpus tetragonolobus]|uniref:Uncharacterized protein n=1 Tax=Psophocarpus tetragonolobus TaxID=3891 RepID=A0AAN9T5L0_PSOTE